MFSVVPFLDSIFLQAMSFRFLESSDHVTNVKMDTFYVLFIHLCLSVPEFHEMNNQNRQVPLDDYSPHEALQSLPFYKRSNYSTACNNLSLTTHLQKRSFFDYDLRETRYFKGKMKDRCLTNETV